MSMRTFGKYCAADLTKRWSATTPGWVAAKIAARDEKRRAYLVSRQIGATTTFIQEAVIHAITTGVDQIFIAAASGQARRMELIARSLLGLDTKSGTSGRLVLRDRDGAWETALYFLSPYLTKGMMDFTGDVYLDSLLWAEKPAALLKAARWMARDGHRVTMWSAASYLDDAGAKLWTGLGKDREAWLTGTTTIHDAVSAGFDLIDVEDLRHGFSEDHFANMFECKFVPAPEREAA